MKYDIRLKFFGVAILIIILTMCGVEFYINKTFERAIEERAEDELNRLVQIFKDDLDLATPDFASQSYQALAHRFAGSSDLRVTILAANGDVLGDSAHDQLGLRSLGNHAGRAEVIAARTQGKGMAKRIDHALKIDFLYMAVPFGKDSVPKILRVAMPINTLNILHDQIHMTTLGVGFFALVITAIMIVLSFHYMLNPVLQTVVSKKQGKSIAHLREIIPTGNLAQRLELALNALKEERDLLNAVLEGIDNGIIATDENGEVTLCNQAAQVMFGCLTYRHSDGCNAGPLSPHPCIQKFTQTLTDKVLNNEEFVIESGKTILVKSGRFASPRSGTVVVIRDITEERKLEKMRKDLIANVSHELRTPLTTMRSSVETLLAGGLNDPAQAKHFVSVLLRNTTLLSGLVEDLLDLSRIDAGEYNLEMQGVSVLAAGYRALEHLDQAAKNKSLVIQMLVPEGTVIFADEQAFDQVLFNLLNNAVKYTPENGRITLRASNEGDMVKIEVVDTGPGIAPEFHHRIFERFFRIDAGRSREAGGTGLGLSIVKDLVEQMNGLVWVECPEKIGSIFCLKFPREEV
ncbi:MAG: hypothetical protein A2X86_04025 [Bdellovibrionales bacterium GWA2_49_15]|nr:MAG: hypothetical protein A2X86_04025 [Bdellovibrionales bacterium GWA2_49_15]HAZ12825.1 hypothetical protein [Bdellovibrionales bacterium]